MKFKPKHVKINDMNYEQMRKAVLSFIYAKFLSDKGMGRKCPKCKKKEPLDSNYCSECRTYLGFDNKIERFRDKMNKKTDEEIAELVYSL